METVSLTRRGALSVFLTLSGVAATSLAQAPSSPPAPGSYEPIRGQPGKDVMWIASPDAVVERMLQMAEVRTGDLVVDLGSGDGKIPIAAARLYGVRARGLEYNPQLVELSTRRARDAGVTDKVSFERADIFVADFSSATVVTMYLLPELNLRLRPILFAMRPGTRVVSHSFNMVDWQPDETSRSGTGEIMLWRIPANASGTWRVAAPGLGNAPQTLSFAQKFQFLDGQAGFGQLTAGIVRPLLSGDALTFQLRDPTGAVLHFKARVAADRITGTAARDGQSPVAFEAVRTGATAPIGGIVPTPAEVQAASRALN